MRYMPEENNKTISYRLIILFQVAHFFIQIRVLLLSDDILKTTDSWQSWEIKGFYCKRVEAYLIFHFSHTVYYNPLTDYVKTQ